ncbi:MAG: flagellar basal body P-ring formation protein FlgA [candidate division Zixibacteria bacterium]|nr:flagellar basal body P-ring formation protein FlgA [candidate division Zixibacteria bacterium]
MKLFTIVLLLLFITPAFAVEKKEINDAVKEFFDKNIPVTANKLEIDINNYPQLILSMKGDVKITVDGDIPPALRKRISLKIVAVESNGSESSAYITANLSRMIPVVCSKRLIKRNEKLSEENCIVFPADLIEFSGKPAFNISELLERRVSGNINGGEIIDYKKTEPIPLILRGDIVNILTRAGNMKITAQGTAREDGCPGEFIRVRNSNSGKTVTGQVTEEGLVEVSYLR